MATATPQLYRPITREDWLRILTIRVVPEAERLRKRRNRRYEVPDGLVKLVFTLETGVSRVAVVRTAGLLQISKGGLMVKSHKPIPLGTGVAMDVNLGDHAFTILGRVKHCTGTLGGFKVGIRVQFPDQGI